MINPYLNNRISNIELMVDIDWSLIRDEYTLLLIKELYDFRYHNSGEADLNVLISRNNWVKSRIFMIINHLEKLKWIRCWNSIGKYTLTGVGAVQSIHYNLICSDYAKTQESQRFELFKFLASQYQITTRHSFCEKKELALRLNKSIDDLNVFIADLSDLGYLNISKLRLTEEGYQQFNYENKWRKVINEFNIIKKSSPQKRGVEFEKVFSKVLCLNSWDVEHSVKSLNEENDLIILKHRENYIIELKWINKPVQAHFIRNLVVKLSNRKGMDGIFISMSGFTSGAILQVKEQSNNQLIYLFGPKDIEEIFNKSKTFDELLFEKHKYLQLKKEIIWS